ncbi:MAG: bifunctional oligoribonuclease/PAP phosphatase NrnA [Spirochaetaceae bacterium]|nr:bifunctional oligoribonuclease/PAP phosphatase NrnA [Spirochaetaceae bacterium]
MYTRLPVPQPILDFIGEGSFFLVAGHREPDGDCAGSQLALGALLERLGKDVTLISAGPWDRAEIAPFRERFKDTVDGHDRQNTRLIVVDCSTLERVGKRESALLAALAEFPTAFIDHHKTADRTGLCYINPTAPASAALVLALWEAFGQPLTQEAAAYLLFGLSTDTGFFRHLDADAETLADAQKLAAAGASLKKTFAAINGGRTLNSRKLLGTVLAKAESYYDGRLVVCTEEREETERFGRENRDSDMLYQLLQSVGGVEAIVVVRQDTPEKCVIGFRSKDAVDVSAIAAAFGGGGHKNAAGASVEGVISELKAQVIEQFYVPFGR